MSERSQHLSDVAAGRDTSGSDHRPSPPEGPAQMALTKIEVFKVHTHGISWGTGTSPGAALHAARATIEASVLPAWMKEDMQRAIAALRFDLAAGPTPPLCEEADDCSQDFYVPCQAPATTLVNNGDRRPYWMCGEHAHHNVINRRAIQIWPATGSPTP